MTKSVLTAAIWLTFGVILGFAILLISEKRLFTPTGSDASAHRPASRVASEPLLIAELKAEIARLEARFARLAVHPERPARLDDSAPPTGGGEVLDARTRTTRESEPARHLAGGDLERLPAPSEYKDDAVIEGTVQVELGGRPVTRFTIGVKSEDGAWARKEIRDLKGRFSWVLGPGRARIFISAPGYTDWLRTDLVLERGMVTRIKVRLAPVRRLEGRAAADPGPASAATRYAS